MAWILVAAAVVRLFFFLEVRQDPTFTVPIWDAAIFDEMARSLASGQGTGYPKAFFFGPLYPYFLALVYAITDASMGAAVFLQHLFGVLLCLLTYRMGRHWFGHRAGLVAAGLMALAGVEIFFEGALLMEVLVSVLLAGQITLLIWPETESSRTRLAAAGLMLGLAAIGRPTLLLLAAAEAVFLLRSTPLPRRVALTGVVIFLAAVAIAPTATMVRNYATENVLVPITSSGGFNFYMGYAGSLENQRISSDSSWNGENSAEAALGRHLDSAEVSRYWLGLAARDIRDHPGRWLAKYLKKVQLFLNGQDLPQIESYTLAGRRSRLLSLTPVGLHLIAALGVAGLVTAFPRRRELILLYAILGILVLSTAAFFVTTRYRVVALPYLFIFGAGYLMMLGKAAHRRRWKHFLILLAIGIGAGLFTMPARFPINERTREYAQYLHDGFRYAKVEQNSQALAAYARAQEVWPQDYESHLGEGLVHRDMGQLDLSLQALETAMRYNTVDAVVPYQLGVTLYQMNRFEAAEHALRRSLEMSSRRALTHAYLGLTLASMGRDEPATAAFRTSLDLDPHQAFTHSNFGAFLAMQGDLQAASLHLLRALELDPGFVHARRNLAHVYLEEGDQAAAVNQLRKLLELSPDDQQARQLLQSLNH